MRTILTPPAVILSAVVVVAAACAPRPQPHPVDRAPYLLHVPAPGTDYRYRSGAQGFGRTGPVHAPVQHGPQPYAYPDYGYVHPLPPEHPPHGAGHSYEHGRPGGYVWGERRESISGGHAYESREYMTEETWVGGGVIVERDRPREPHRPHDSDLGYPGPYALAPRHAEPAYHPEPRPYPHAAPEAPPPPSPPAPPRNRPPWPDPGPEPFY